MMKIKIIILLITGLSMTIVSCSEEEQNPNPNSKPKSDNSQNLDSDDSQNPNSDNNQNSNSGNNKISIPDQLSTNKKTGFVMVVKTPRNTTLVKYFETIPVGTADLRNGVDFQEFNVQDAYNGALFLENTDLSKGMSKYVVDKDGVIKKEKEFASFGRVDPIAIKDENTGLYFDHGDRSNIHIFDPGTMEVLGAIDMSSGVRPVQELIKYREFYFKDNKVFAPLASDRRPRWYNPLVIHTANFRTATITDDIKVLLKGPARHNFMFGGKYEDDKGNLYIADEGDVFTKTPARLHRITNGTSKVDLNYEFDIAGALNPNNPLYRVFNGFSFIGNGKAIATVTTKTPPELLAILGFVVFDPTLLTPTQTEEIEDVTSNDESSPWCLIDLDQKTVTTIEGIPTQNVNHRYAITEFEGKWYLPVKNRTVNAYYSYDPVTGETAKAFDVIGGSIQSFINIANNN